MARPGKIFEDAVVGFIKRLDPNAKVYFNHTVADRDTGRPRQVDGWAEYRVGNHIPVSMLISCKDHARPLDVQEVESCLAEMASTGANAGVLYSRSGFTAGALEKAQAKSLQCCRYYDDAPPDFPTGLLLAVYMAVPVYVVAARAIRVPYPKLLTWGMLFKAFARTGSDASLPRLIAGRLRALFEQSGAPTPGFPAEAAVKLGPLIDEITLPRSPQWPAVPITLTLSWDWFRADVDAFRATGSFNETQPDFKGTMRVGPIPLTSTPSGWGWSPCGRPDPVSDENRFSLVALSFPQEVHVRRLMSPAPVDSTLPIRFGLSPGELSRSLATISGGEPMGMNVTFDFNGPSAPPQS